MRCACGLALAAMLIGGCAGPERVKDEGEVGWARLVSLVRDCEVKRVDQAHSRLVTIILRDGRKAFAREPRIDAIIPVVNRANEKCGPITFATE